MPMRTDEAPRRQQDRDRQPGSSPSEEPRNSETPSLRAVGKADTEPQDDPFEQIEDINTQGSER